MRVLLDECVPRQLADDLKPHETRTVQQMSWTGIKNGALLDRAAGEFDVLFTIDRDFAGPPSQTGSNLILVILAAGTSDFARLRPFMTLVLDTLERAQPGQVIIVSA